LISIATTKQQQHLTAIAYAYQSIPFKLAPINKTPGIKRNASKKSSSHNVSNLQPIMK
jgi:hypothetical protein